MFDPQMKTGGALFHPEAFPRIARLDDVAPHVAGNRGIRLFHDGPISVLVYLLNESETFQTPYDLECRGLVFDRASKELLSRPFHKFHNHAGAPTEEALLAAGPVRFYDKLDGSMTPGFVLDGQVRLHTKGGLTSTAERAEERLAPKDKEMIAAAWKAGFTPIFEWTAPDNRVVLPYTENAFTLLAVRDRLTGAYDEDLADGIAARFDIPRPKVLGTAATVEELRAWAQKIFAMEGVEGVVAVGPDGRRAKMKTRSYLVVHRALSMMGFERHAFRIVVEDRDDDLLPLLTTAQAEVFSAYAHALRQAILAYATRVEAQARALAAPLDGDKRAIAAAISAGVAEQDRPLAFAALQGKPAFLSLQGLLQRRLGSAQLVEEACATYSLPRWDPPKGMFLVD